MYNLVSVFSENRIDYDSKLFDTFHDALNDALNIIFEPDAIQETIDDWIEEGNDPDYTSIEREANIPEYITDEARQRLIKIQLFINMNRNVFSSHYFSFKRTGQDDTFIYEAIMIGESIHHVEINVIDLPPGLKRTLQDLRDENNNLNKSLIHKTYKPGNIGALESKEDYIRKSVK